MKICMLAYAHYMTDARIKSYVQTLETAGHVVDVIALRSESEPSKEATVRGTIWRVMDKYQGQSKALYACSYLVFFLKAFLLLGRRSVRNRYDVIHVHNMPNVLVFAAAIPKLLGAKVMLDVHDLMTVNYMAKFGASEGDFPVRTLKAEQRIAAMFADHLFCADHNQQDYLVEHCSVARDKITVLMNLPNTKLFGPMVPKKQSESNSFRIVYHGTIAHRLGIDLILRAMEKVVAEIPAELWIYGAGDYLPEALELSTELGLDGRVHFSRSFFPVERIREFVSVMDLGIIGNRRNLACDQFMLPVKLLEYVYLGVPVVAPRLGVIQRYFDDRMIRLYEPENVMQMAESIVDLFHHPEERQRLTSAASEFYEKHNIAAQADCYMRLITGSDGRLCPVAG